MHLPPTSSSQLRAVFRLCVPPGLSIFIEASTLASIATIADRFAVIGKGKVLVEMFSISYIQSSIVVVEKSFENRHATQGARNRWRASIACTRVRQDGTTIMQGRDVMCPSCLDGYRWREHMAHHDAKGYVAVLDPQKKNTLLREGRPSCFRKMGTSTL